MIDERDIPDRERLEKLYNRVLHKRNPYIDRKATGYDIDMILERFKQLNEDMIKASKENKEHPISAIIDYLMCEVLESYINRIEDFNEG